jgi:hypothetical protein
MEISEILIKNFSEKKMKLNNYLNNLLYEGKDISNKKIEQNFLINFHFEKEKNFAEEIFNEKSSGFFLQFCNGQEALNIIETKYEEFEKGEFAFGIKFKFFDIIEAEKNLIKIENFVNKKILNFLNDIGSMLIFIEPIFEFKVVENFVCMYYVSKLPQLNNFVCNFKGLIEGSLQFFTNLKFEDLIKKESFEEICEIFFNMKINLNLKMFDFKNIIRKIINNIEALEDKDNDNKEKDKNNDNDNKDSDKDNDNEFEGLFTKKLKDFISLLNIYLFLNKINLDFSFDSKGLKNWIFNYIKKKKENNNNDNQNENELFVYVYNDDDIEIKLDLLTLIKIIEFLINELRAFFNELYNNKDNLRNFFIENQDLNFLEKIDLNEIIFELQSKSFITPFFIKLDLQIPTLKEMLDKLIKDI